MVTPHVYMMAGGFLLLLGVYGIFAPANTVRFAEKIEYRTRGHYDENPVPTDRDIKLTRLVSSIFALSGAIILSHAIVPPQYLSGHLKL
jgi:hypothetical protein